MEWKRKGNEFFKLASFGSAVQCYTKSIELVIKSNNLNKKGLELYVLYSNRSASYLQFGKPDLALQDAEQSIKLNSNFAKAFGRKGKALFDLEKFRESKEAYEQGLALDPASTFLAESLQQCITRIGEEADDYGEENLEDAKLDAFLDEIDDLATSKPVSVPSKSFTVNHKEQTKSWTSENQIARLTQPNFKWINLNPFEVLQLPYTANEDDIKRRYKKLSQLVHPDKQVDKTSNSAQLAFDELQKAFQTLKDKHTKSLLTQLISSCIRTVYTTHEELLKKGKLTKNASNEQQMTEELEKECQIEIKKVFAEREMLRLKSEGMKRKYEQREKEKQAEEYEYWQNIKKHEVKFRDTVKERVNEWQSFDDSLQQKKGVKDHGRREQELKKHKGAGKDESYKVQWR